MSNAHEDQDAAGVQSSGGEEDLNLNQLSEPNNQQHAQLNTLGYQDEEAEAKRFTHEILESVVNNFEINNDNYYSPQHATKTKPQPQLLQRAATPPSTPKVTEMILQDAVAEDESRGDDQSSDNGNLHNYNNELTDIPLDDDSSALSEKETPISLSSSVHAFDDQSDKQTQPQQYEEEKVDSPPSRQTDDFQQQFDALEGSSSFEFNIEKEVMTGTSHFEAVSSYTAEEITTLTESRTVVKSSFSVAAETTAARVDDGTSFFGSDEGENDFSKALGLSAQQSSSSDNININNDNIAPLAQTDNMSSAPQNDNTVNEVADVFGNIDLTSKDDFFGSLGNASGNDSNHHLGNQHQNDYYGGYHYNSNGYGYSNAGYYNNDTTNNYDAQYSSYGYDNQNHDTYNYGDGNNSTHESTDTTETTASTSSPSTHLASAAPNAEAERTSNGFDAIPENTSSGFNFGPSNSAFDDAFSFSSNSDADNFFESLKQQEAPKKQPPTQQKPAPAPAPAPTQQQQQRQEPQFASIASPSVTNTTPAAKPSPSPAAIGTPTNDIVHNQHQQPQNDFFGDLNFGSHQDASFFDSLGGQQQQQLQHQQSQQHQSQTSFAGAYNYDNRHQHGYQQYQQHGYDNYYQSYDNYYQDSNDNQQHAGYQGYYDQSANQQKHHYDQSTQYYRAESPARVATPQTDVNQPLRHSASTPNLNAHGSPAPTGNIRYGTPHLDRTHSHQDMYSPAHDDQQYAQYYQQYQQQYQYDQQGYYQHQQYQQGYNQHQQYQQYYDQSGQYYQYQTQNQNQYQQYQHYHHPQQQQPQYNPRDDQFKPAPHPVVAFGFGGKMCIMFPRQPRKLNALDNRPDHGLPRNKPGNINVYNLSDVLGNTPSVSSMKRFPGPLAPNSPKDKLLSFISEEMQINELEVNGANVVGVRMLWELLKIFCNQNGNVTFTPGSEGFKAVQSILANKVVEDNWVNDTQPSSVLVSGRPQRSESDIQHATLELQRLLLEGKRQEACQRAVDSELWAQALLISSMIDMTTYQKVVTEFSTATLKDGTPLRTLYLLFANRSDLVFQKQQQPGVISSSVVENWQENLAMILSNRTSDSDRAIARLGDSIWQDKDEVEAAHFCYLIAGLTLEAFGPPGSRLVLLGGDHKRRPKYFINPTTIQRTEILEYAKQKANPQFILPSFQVYKFIYARWLADMGLLAKAGAYVKSITNTVKASSKQYSYNPYFMHYLSEFQAQLQSVGAQAGDASHGRTASGGFGWIRRVFDSSLNAIINADETPSQQQQQQQQQGARIASPAAAPATRQMPVQQQQQQQQQLQQQSQYQQQQPQRAPSVPVPATAPAQDVPKQQENAKTAEVSASPKSKEGSSWGFLNPLNLIPRKQVKQVRLGCDNQYRWDENLKRWVRPGQELNPEALKPAVPPKLSNLPAGAPPPFQHSQRIAHTNASSRYLDPFAATSGGAATPPPGAGAQVAQPPQQAARSTPPPTRFFVPKPAPQHSTSSAFFDDYAPPPPPHDHHQQQQQEQQHQPQQQQQQQYQQYQYNNNNQEYGQYDHQYGGGDQQQQTYY